MVIDFTVSLLPFLWGTIAVALISAAAIWIDGIMPMPNPHHQKALAAPAHVGAH